MTVHVYEAPQLPIEDNLKIALPPSALRVSQPIQVSANHALGWLNGGLLHLQRAFAAQSTTGTARIMVMRHPNCDYIDALIQPITTGQAWQIDVTAGGGVTESASSSYHWSAYPGSSSIRIRAPYDSADSGAVEITVVTTNCSIQSMAIYAVPRETLSVSGGDDAIESVDSTYLRIGLIPERYIADNDEAGPPALVDMTYAAWDDFDTQLMSWWTWESAPFSTTATSYGGSGAASDVFAGHSILARTRQRRSTQSRGTATYYVYCWTTDGSTSGEIQVSATNPGPGANDSAVSAGFSGAAGAWVTISVEVDSTTDASILVEAKRTAGSGTVYVSAVSAIGID